MRTTVIRNRTQRNRPNELMCLCSAKTSVVYVYCFAWYADLVLDGEREPSQRRIIMPPRQTPTEESPSTIFKRSFDMPRYEEFKQQLAERDASPTLFMRRVVLDYLDKKYISISYLSDENKALMAEIAGGLKTSNMQIAFETALNELRLLRHKPKK